MFEAAVDPVGLFEDVTVATTVSLVVVTVVVAAALVGTVDDMVVGTMFCLTWAQKLLYHTCKSCLSADNEHSARHTESGVVANVVKKAELQKH